MNYYWSKKTKQKTYSRNKNSLEGHNLVANPGSVDHAAEKTLFRLKAAGTTHKTQRQHLALFVRPTSEHLHGAQLLWLTWLLVHMSRWASGSCILWSGWLSLACWPTCSRLPASRLKETVARSRWDFLSVDFGRILWRVLSTSCSYPLVPIPPQPPRPWRPAPSSARFCSWPFCRRWCCSDDVADRSFLFLVDWRLTGEIGYLRSKKQKRYLRSWYHYFFFPSSSEWVTRSLHGNPCQWASLYEQEALSSFMPPKATSRVSWFLDGRGVLSPPSLFKSSFSPFYYLNLYWRRRKDKSVDWWLATEAASAGYILFFYYFSLRANDW